MTRKQKKIGNPTQPSYRSVGNRSVNHRNPTFILHHIFLFFKNKKFWSVLFFVSVWLLALFLQGSMTGVSKSACAEVIQESPTYIFKDGDGCSVDVQRMTNAWATEAGTTKRYNLTDAERWEIASVVTAEAAGEPFAGKMAVAQCILQSCEDDGIRPSEALIKYEYTTNRPSPSEEVLEAVEAVFDFGIVVTYEPIKYFYAPACTTSSWHESQDYVLTINNHKFFK